jgi:hypothetical protein
MTLPAHLAGQPADGTPERQSTDESFDDLAQLGQTPSADDEPAAPDLNITLQGDNIPEEFRGMSVRDLIQRAEGQREVIRGMGRVQPAPATPTAPVPTAPATPDLPTLTQDQFRQMYEEDPVNALQVYDQVRTAHLMREFEQRIQPLIGGASGNAEALARQRHVEEFTVLGDEIKAAVAQVADKRVLSQPHVWDELIYYVRGKHIDKILEHRQKSAPREESRDVEGQFDNLPPRLPSARTPAGGRGRRMQLNEEQRENARILGMSEEEYAKHYV